jgi:hypothetical protein
MNEDQYAALIVPALQKSLLSQYEVLPKANLQHTLIFRENGKVWPEVQPFDGRPAATATTRDAVQSPASQSAKGWHAKRGRYAYQTDILVTRPGENKVPLVVIELKCRTNTSKKGAFNGSTHELLVYSGKATRHKELYPYLRYGMAVAGAPSVGRKFFLHNRGMDFVIAVPNPQQVEQLASVVLHQAKLAEERLKLYDDRFKKGVVCWQSGMKWEWATTQDDLEVPETEEEE